MNLRDKNRNIAKTLSQLVKEPIWIDIDWNCAYIKQIDSRPLRTRLNTIAEFRLDSESFESDIKEELIRILNQGTKYECDNISGKHRDTPGE